MTDEGVAISTHWIGFHNWMTFGMSLKLQIITFGAKWLPTHPRPFERWHQAGSYRCCRSRRRRWVPLLLRHGSSPRNPYRRSTAASDPPSAMQHNNVYNSVGLVHQVSVWKGGHCQAVVRIVRALHKFWDLKFSFQACFPSIPVAVWAIYLIPSHSSNQRYNSWRNPLHHQTLKCSWLQNQWGRP